jgi:hypothetical protein
VRKVFEEYGIRQIDTRSIFKASIVERLNQTLLAKIFRYLTFKKTKTYINVLDKIVYSYNHSYHTAIKCSPSEVNSKNVEKIKQLLYGPPDKPQYIEFFFKLGTYVRKINDKSIFTKGYVPTWSDDVYVVVMLNPSVPPTYKIKELTENIVEKRMYYKEELQKVPYTDFPYDSFEILKEKNDLSLVKQLNSPDQKQEWVRRIQPSRKK